MCDPPNAVKARTLVERDLREMQTSEVSPTGLRQAKTLLIRHIPLSQSSLDDIAQQMLDLSLEDLSLDEPVRAAKRYHKTDAAEMQAAFKTWIRPDAFVEVTLGPSSKLEEPPAPGRSEEIPERTYCWDPGAIWDRG